MAIYPVRLNYITLSFNVKAAQQEYRIPFDGIYLYYNSAPETGITSPQLTDTAAGAQKVIINGQLVIINNGHIYNLLGHEITY